MPIETMMVKRNVAFISLLYLPHAVSMLGGMDGWAKIGFGAYSRLDLRLSCDAP
jgi:hypothetical protein